jgi:L-amino acid N-acyltransferase YncA
MGEYCESSTLDDGTEITVRHTTIADVDKVMEFFDALPVAEKQCVRSELNGRADFERRYEKISKGEIARLVAEVGGRIVGEASLESMRYGWLRKSGEVRMMVLPDYRDKGAAKVLAREIFLLAARRGLENLISRVIECQLLAFETLRSLHFKHEATQKNHAVDMEGRLHDVRLMTFSLRQMWRDMEEAIVESITSPLD